MSHDADKLIRQLSLVAFLMAERRALTARDVKSCVEGYADMSDEAFARRFYSDRTELGALGVPLESQRDEFTGEELYTLRSDQYFLPPLELSDDEFAALQTGFYLLEGQFAYAEPLRLALQNLALGRPAADDAPTDSAVRVNVLGNDYSADMPGRLTKLEAAISKQRTVRFNYWTIGRNAHAERTVNPYALFSDNGSWYLAGLDLEREDERTFRVSRIRGDIRFATRRERDFRPPEHYDTSSLRGRPNWQVGEIVGDATIAVSADTAWWVERAFTGRGVVKRGTFTTPYASLHYLAGWILRQDGNARAVDPPELVALVEEGRELVLDRHAADPPKLSGPAKQTEEEHSTERSPGPLVPERFAVLQALLAHLLGACGESKHAAIPAAELMDRFRLSTELLEEHLQLLNLINFGGGCYAICTKLDGDTVTVEKELFGDVFRGPPRLTPLEARAIRLALDFVGPMIAAEANMPLERVRRKLEETFGQFEIEVTEEPPTTSDEETLIRALSLGVQGRRLVSIEYLSTGSDEVTERTVEPYSLERRLPHWYVHTWDRTRDGARSFRLDRMKQAELLPDTFEPRTGFDPAELSDSTTARVWYSPQVARWRLERHQALSLADGSAIEDVAVGSFEWLVSEILSFRGEAVVLEPPALRKKIATRARRLKRELASPKPPKRKKPTQKTSAPKKTAAAKEKAAAKKATEKSESSSEKTAAGATNR